MSLYRIDIPAGNFDIIKNFYHGVFGWTFEKEDGTSEEWSINFGSEVPLMPIAGGIISRSARTQPICCYFLVPSIDETSEKIKKLGGVVFIPKTAVPGKGYYACCLDPEENYFVIWEKEEKAKY
jgi:predicted enzyme related to lactoylglutathione lyase